MTMTGFEGVKGAWPLLITAGVQGETARLRDLRFVRLFLIDVLQGMPLVIVHRSSIRRA